MNFSENILFLGKYYCRKWRHLSFSCSVSNRKFCVAFKDRSNVELTSKSFVKNFYFNKHWNFLIQILSNNGFCVCTICERVILGQATQLFWTFENFRLRANGLSVIFKMIGRLTPFIADRYWFTCIISRQIGVQSWKFTWISKIKNSRKVYFWYFNCMSTTFPSAESFFDVDENTHEWDK